MIMGMCTRVPFATLGPSHCHKYVSITQCLHQPPISSSSLLRSLPQNPFSISSPSLSLSRKRVGICGVVTVTAMADSSKSTVLVTGAGGRTGIFLSWVSSNFSLFWTWIRKQDVWFDDGYGYLRLLRCVIFFLKHEDWAWGKIMPFNWDLIVGELLSLWNLVLLVTILLFIAP